MASRHNKVVTAATRTPIISTAAADPAVSGTATPSTALPLEAVTAAADQPERHLEIETKLEIGPDTPLPDLAADQDLARSGVAAVGAPSEYQLDAVYYDTAHLDLLSSKVTLRRRTGGVDAGWHLKLPPVTSTRTGGAGRMEVRMPLGESTDGVPAALAELVRGTARGRVLAPVARLENRRIVRHLLDESGRELVEIADDHVTATRIDAAVSREPARWRELEAEIVDGTTAQLAAAVTALIAGGASPASSASKLGRTLPLPPQPPPARPKSAGAPVIAAIRRARDELIAADRALRDETPGSLHLARVAARRLRSMLSIYSPLFDEGRVRPIRRALRELGVELRPAREIEVVAERIAGQLVDEPEEFARVAGHQLDKVLAQRSAAARPDVVAALNTDSYLCMLRDLDQLIAEPALTKAAAKSAVSELPGLISIGWDRLRELSDRALGDPSDTSTVHEVRKAAKALHYATEAVQSALGEDAVVFAAAIEEIQEVLGEHRDSVISAAMLAELAADPAVDGIAGFTFGRLHAFEEAIAHGAIDDFADAWNRVEDGDLLAALVR